jgi:hypothetical protein
MRTSNLVAAVAVFGGLSLMVGCGGMELNDTSMGLADAEGDGTTTQSECEAKGKALVCHIPPGNPANAHSICVSKHAVPAHEAHGDVLGACGGGAGGTGGDSSGDTSGDTGGDTGGTGGDVTPPPDTCAGSFCSAEHACCAGYACVSGQCVLPPQ